MLHIFKSNLVGKEKLFDLLAISHATGYPVLFEGEKGTAKTQAAVDYMSGFEDSKIFKLELTEGTSISSIRGYLDINALVNEKIERYVSDIAECQAILINEVDKANSAIRNAMLGLMAEKKLMYGKDVIDCNYKLFIGTCNHINTDEEETPFWDRFILKYKVNRLSISELFSSVYLTEQTYVYDIPESGLEEPIDDKVFMDFVNCMYNYMSDRSIFRSIRIINAIKGIFKIDDASACFIAAGYIDSTAASLFYSNSSFDKKPEDVIKRIDIMYDGTGSSIDAIRKYISVIETTNALKAEELNNVKIYLKSLKSKIINV